MPHALLRPTTLLSALACLALGPACGTSSASQDTTPNAPLALTSSNEAPPHVFTPRQHPPRTRPRPPAPDLASLPAMVDRRDACFGRVVEEQGGWSSPPPSSRGGGKKTKSKKRPSRPPGFVQYGSGGASGGVVGGKASGTTSSTTTRSPKTDSKPSGSSGSKGRKSAESSADIGALLDPSQGNAGGSAPPSASPAAKPEAEPSRSNDARDRKEIAANDDDEAGGALVTEQSAPVIAADADDGYHDWGQSIYLSNDDTMSLSSAQRVIFAIDNFLPLPAEHIRPHELLNYFSFDTAPVAETDDFSIDASIAPDPEQEGIYSLAMAVRGRPLGIDERRNANLSIVIDRSGSMSAEGRMEYLKRGLQQMTGQLKTGDMVSLVLFDHEVCVPVENFVVGRDSPAVFVDAVRSLEPRGSTDLHAGLRRGYEVADHSYQPSFSNRVVMITDAIANSGVTDQELISTVSRFYDDRRIRLSGVGVGRDFNDSLLDSLTEQGKGAYVFLGSEAEVDAVFGSRFISLIETTALDVHFRLHLPPSLRMNVFYGEESSVVKEDVQAIHYFANTSQLFLSDLMARDGVLRSQDDVMLTVEYEDPESGDDMVEEYAFNLGEITEQSRNVRKGRLVMRFVDGLAWMASRPTPSVFGSRGGSWDDGDAWEACEAGRQELTKLAEGIGDDPEVVRVRGLWDKYCSRYQQPRTPVRRDPPATGWPSASGG